MRNLMKDWIDEIAIGDDVVYDHKIWFFKVSFFANASTTSARNPRWRSNLSCFAFLLADFLKIFESFFLDHTVLWPSSNNYDGVAADQRDFPLVNK